MKVVVCLMKGQSVIDETEFPSESLGESAMRGFLRSTYQLESGYEITYVDPDGDEIIVEFDDDYEVAKLTHQEVDSLKLNVKVSNEQWLAQFADSPQHKTQQNQSLISSTDQKTEVIASIIHQATPATNSQSDPILPLIKKQSDEEKTQLIPVQLKENTQHQKYDQHLEQIKAKIEDPKIKTQTESSSQDQQNYLLLPSLNTKQIADSDHLETPNQQTSQMKPEKMKEQTKSKPKKESKKHKKEQKQKKQSIQKPEKQNDTFTEKQIKKLIKKEVFKLIPQISQQLKKLNQNQHNYFHSYESLTSSHCSKCEQQLTVPFYINSSEGIKLCENCEEQDLSLIPLIKIKDPQMIEKLSWGEPLCQCEVITDQEKNPVKFYTEVKKLLLDELKQKMDRKIKKAKTEVKNEKAEQNLLKKKKKQTKHSNQDGHESGSSSV